MTGLASAAFPETAVAASDGDRGHVAVAMSDQLEACRRCSARQTSTVPSFDAVR